MLDPFFDSSLRNQPAAIGQIRRLGETADRRLWIASTAQTSRMADISLAGLSIRPMVVASLPSERRASGAIVGFLTDVVGRS